MPLTISSKGILTASPLTSREREVMELMAKGLKQKEIADYLSITMNTAKTHIRKAYKKLDAHNKVDALRKAGIW